MSLPWCTPGWETRLIRSRCVSVILSGPGSGVAVVMSVQEFKIQRKTKVRTRKLLIWSGQVQGVVQSVLYDHLVWCSNQVWAPVWRHHFAALLCTSRLLCTQFCTSPPSCPSYLTIAPRSFCFVLQRYLLAAIGSGFCMFDVIAGEWVPAMNSSLGNPYFLLINIFYADFMTFYDSLHDCVEQLLNPNVDFEKNRVLGFLRGHIIMLCLFILFDNSSWM